MIRISEKRKLFICILISLLVYGLNWFGLSNIFEPDQGLFSFDSLKGSTSHDNESYPVPLSLGHVNQSDIAIAVTRLSTNRASSVSIGSIWNTFCSRLHRDLEDIQPRIVDCPDTAFKLAKIQACQYLDIPPPFAPALL